MVIGLGKWSLTRTPCATTSRKRPGFIVFQTLICRHQHQINDQKHGRPESSGQQGEPVQVSKSCCKCAVRSGLF